MAYHNLDHSPVPSAPFRYPELSEPLAADPAYVEAIPLTPQPPLAQPVAHPVQGTAVPEAHPVARPAQGRAPPQAHPVAHPVAQCAEDSAPMAQVYVARPVAADPPFAQPVAGPSMMVPPRPSLEQLKVQIKRPVRFNGKKYCRESATFFKYNYCKLMMVTLMWGLLFFGLSVGMHKLSARMKAKHDMSGDSFPDPRFPAGGDVLPVPEPLYPDNYTTVPPDEGGWLPDDADLPPGASEPGFQGDEEMPMPEPSLPKPMPPMATSIQKPMMSCCKIMCAVGLFLVEVLIGFPALSGMYLAVFNAMRTNGPIRFRDFFSSFCPRYWCRLLPLALSVKFLTVLLSLLLVLPGIWFAVVSLFAIPLHREHPFLGARKSIRFSRKAISRHFCSMLCFLLGLAVLQALGFLLFGVGLLFTVPLAFVALCYCYNDLIGVNDMPMMVQPVAV